MTTQDVISGDTSVPVPVVFLPAEEVSRRCSVTPKTLSRWVAAKQFPAPVQISSRRIAWVESEVLAWQQEILRKAGRA